MWIKVQYRYDEEAAEQLQRQIEEDERRRKLEAAYQAHIGAESQREGRQIPCDLF